MVAKAQTSVVAPAGCVVAPGRIAVLTWFLSRWNTRHSLKRLTGATAVALLALAALPGVAWGAVVVGSDLTNLPNANGTCGSGGCTTLETATTPNAIKSPMDGVIVSWSSRGGSGTVGTFGTLRVRVLRNTSGTTFLAVRSGPMHAVPTRATNDMFTIPVNPGLPIGVNDYVGIDVLGASGALAQRTPASASFTYQGWQPPLADGVTAPPTFGPFNSVREMLYQATIEPDADHDRFGDETQDRCPGRPGSSQGCPVGAPPAPDTDRDGVPDPSDRCPNVRRGAFDVDHDGCVGPYRRIAAKLIGSWSVDDRGVTVGSMRLSSLPMGARVRLVCGPCHVRQKLKPRRRSVALKRLRGELLRRGKGFTVTITRRGMIGQRTTLRVKHYGHTRAAFLRAARRPFTRHPRCIPAGRKKPAKRCPARPPRGP